MRKQTYIIMVCLATIIAFILVCMTGGFGPLFSNPIDYIYVGYLLGLTILYYVVPRPAR